MNKCSRALAPDLVPLVALVGVTSCLISPMGIGDLGALFASGQGRKEGLQNDAFSCDSLTTRTWSQAKYMK